MLHIRAEQGRDVPALRALNRAAFPGPEEARLVDALRSSGEAALSLVAELDEKLVGHILFSPVACGRARGLGLAPMAVLPEHQRSGIGGALVREGLAAARAAGHGWVVVLGHASYYPRFGFRPAREFDLHCKWDPEGGSFFALELRQGALEGVAGPVSYAAAFDEV